MYRQNNFLRQFFTEKVADSLNDSNVKLGTRVTEKKLVIQNV